MAKVNSELVPKMAGEFYPPRASLGVGQDQVGLLRHRSIFAAPVFDSKFSKY